MRSSWSAERLLATGAAITAEAAWLALAYILVDWLGGAAEPYLDIGVLAAAVAAGLIAARLAADLPHLAFVALLLVLAVLASLAAALAGGVASPDLQQVMGALSARPLVWIVGLALLRGSARSDRGDDPSATERLLNLGVPGLVVAWLVAATSGLAQAPAFGEPAFAATLTFMTAGLLSFGLGRLGELEVDLVDQRGRRRWLALLFAVTGLALTTGVAAAPFLGYPVSAAVDGALGPVGPIVRWLITVLATIIVGALSFMFDAIAALHLFGPGGSSPVNGSGGPGPLASPGTIQPPPAPIAPAPDGTWLVVVFVILGVSAVVALALIFLRRPTTGGTARGVREVRTPEPFNIQVGARAPRLLPALGRRPTPHDAVAAYRSALAAVAGRAEGRDAWETPREHSARVANGDLGSPIGRLAVDYELAALAERRLTEREQRRAITRWRHVSRVAAGHRWRP